MKLSAVRSPASSAITDASTSATTSPGSTASPSLRLASNDGDGSMAANVAAANSSPARIPDALTRNARRPRSAGVEDRFAGDVG